MALRSRTVEFLRFGDPTGIIRLSDRYIRAIGSEPTEEVSFGIRQDLLDFGMKSLAYDNFKRADRKDVLCTAETFLDAVARQLETFLAGMLTSDDTELCQIDIVTQAKELAQLPFEVLEEKNERIVITRRVRQSWPLPQVLRQDERASVPPRILFVWSAPGRQYDVPHEEHRTALDAVVATCGGGEIVELPMATRVALRHELSGAGGFTHLHILAHGVGPERGGPILGAPFDPLEAAPPRTNLALSGGDGKLDRCSPEELAAMLASMAKLPESATIATCHGGEVSPVLAGGNLAHAVHTAGVPIVLASQLALTMAGSIQLLGTFLAQFVTGEDPRIALKNCRDALRASKQETYFDRVALVGYVHLDELHDERLRQRRLRVALRQLKATSNRAQARLGAFSRDNVDEKSLTPEQRSEVEQTKVDFELVRQGLAQQAEELEKTDRRRQEAWGLQAQQEEVWGLRASAFKRQAEAAWRLSLVLPEMHAEEWLTHSHEMLEESARSYERAARFSRDYHWTWVQWLVLEAVRTGELESHRRDWITAFSAAQDAAGLWPEEGLSGAVSESVKDRAVNAVYGLGSQFELCLLALLLPEVADLSQSAAIVETFLDRGIELVEKLGERFPLESMHAQLVRYENWWGSDSHWELSEDLIGAAKQFRARMEERAPFLVA